MADRTGPGSNGPGTPPTGPRRGFFTRNPLVLAFVAVLMMFAVTKYFTTANEVSLDFSVFMDCVMRVALAQPGATTQPSTPTGTAPTQVQPPAGDAARRSPFGMLTINPATGTVTGKIRHDAKGAHIPATVVADATTGQVDFRAVKGDYPAGNLADALHARAIPFKYEPTSDWGSYLFIVLPAALFIGVLVMMYRSSRMTGENVLSFGRSRAKIVGEDKTGVSFDDVAGAEEPKEELKEIVDFLKEPDRFTALGGKIPRGVLLVGAPGCGKTLLARAVAGEAGVPFFSISGSDFVEMFVGVGAARVRDLFNTAKQKAPCIIFVDEIDAVGRHRGAGLGGGHDEREQTLNQLLVEMDGFDPRKGVIVVAATNRPDILDPALLRPGRFDRHVVLDAADVRGREAILRIHSRGKPLAPDVDIADIAKRTPGFSGADLANVMNEAALLAARRRRRDISRSEVEEAVERVLAGPERKSKIIGPHEKRILAYHELGHALVARFTPDADPVAKVSIIPRGRGALGYTLMLPSEDRYIVTREQILASITVSLGGRTAEELVFNHQSTGAADDIDKASRRARSMVCRFGMSDALGPVSYDRQAEAPFLGRETEAAETVSDRTAEIVDAEVRKIIDACHAAARRVLEQNRDVLDRLAGRLIEVEVLSAEDFENAIRELRPDLETQVSGHRPAPLAAGEPPAPIPGL